MSDGDGNSVCSVVNNGPAVTLAPGPALPDRRERLHGHARPATWPSTGRAGRCATRTPSSASAPPGPATRLRTAHRAGSRRSASPTRSRSSRPTATRCSGAAAARATPGATPTTSSASPRSPRNYASDAPPATLSTDTPTSIASVKATLQGTINPAGETISGCHSSTRPTPSTRPRRPVPAHRGVRPGDAERLRRRAGVERARPACSATTYHYRLIAPAARPARSSAATARSPPATSPSVVSRRRHALGSRTATVTRRSTRRATAMSGCHVRLRRRHQLRRDQALLAHPSGTSPVNSVTRRAD